MRTGKGTTVGREKARKRESRNNAAEIRAAEMAKQKKRERTVRIFGAVGVVLVVVLIVGLAVIVPRVSGDSGISANGLPTPDASAPVPTGVYNGDGVVPWGVPVGDAPETAPILEIWEDFQCSGCAVVEQTNGKGIQSLAEQGKVRLVWRPTTFLDRNLGNNSSSQATSAWGCAIDAGKKVEYHDALFTNRPSVEGNGWTQDQLISFGEQVGITGPALDTFRTCVQDGTYLAWSANSTEAFIASEAQATPTGFLNGVKIEAQQLADQATLENIVETLIKQ